MFFPFLDYVKYPFSASSNNKVNIVTLSYKAYVTVEISSYFSARDDSRVGANLPTYGTWIFRPIPTISGTGQDYPIVGGGVYPSGTTLLVDDFINISGTLHVFRLPENI
jgi:hypothetical protein